MASPREQRAGAPAEPPPSQPLAPWFLAIGAGAALGLAAAGCYLAWTPATFRSAAILALEAQPDGAAAERLATNLAGILLSDEVLTQALPAGADLASVRGRLTVARPNRLVFEVAAVEGGREEAARLANGVAEAFVAHQARRARQRADEAAPAGPATRAAAARAQLKEAEQRLDAARRSRAGAADERATAEAERALVAARGRLAEARARADALQAALAGGREPALSADDPASPALDRLREQQVEAIRAETALKTNLGPLHPAVRAAEEQSRTARRLVLDEVRRASRLAQQEQANAAARLAQIEQQVAAGQGAASASGARLAELEQQVEAHRAALAAAERADEAALEQVAAATPARLVRPATAEAAQRRPDLVNTLSLGLAGGLLGSLSLAAAVLPRRRRVSAEARSGADRLASEVLMPIEAAIAAAIADSGPVSASAATPAPRETRELAAPSSDAPPVASVAEVWTLPRLGRGPSPQLPSIGTHANPHSAYEAAVRALRQRLDAARAGSGQVVLIASEQAGLGRSTLAAGLARAFAEEGLRVVLVDDGSIASPGSDLPFSRLPIAALGSRAASVQHARLAWALIRLARSAYDVAVVDAPALSCNPFARGGAGAADEVIVLGPGQDGAHFASLTLADPSTLGGLPDRVDEGMPAETRGTLAG